MCGLCESQAKGLWEDLRLPGQANLQVSFLLSLRHLGTGNSDRLILLREEEILGLRSLQGRSPPRLPGTCVSWTNTEIGGGGPPQEMGRPRKPGIILSYPIVSGVGTGSNELSREITKIPVCGHTSPHNAPTTLHAQPGLPSQVPGGATVSRASEG